MIKILSLVKPYMVCHLAAYFVAEHGTSDIEDLVHCNLSFSTQLLEAMKANNCTRLLNVGTAWQHWQNKDYSPVSLYAATKQGFEAILRYFIEARGLSAVTLKLTDTYGPHDSRAKLIPLLVSMIDQPRELDLSPGEQFMDLVYIDDIVEAFCITLALLKEIAPGAYLDYAVRSSDPLSLKDTIRTFESVANSQLLVNFGARPYRQRELMAPWDGALLPNWSPRVSLAEGLKITIKERGGGVASRPARRQLLSFVIPCFNEYPNIEPLCQRILGTCEALPDFEYEIVFVENGSSDASEKLIRDLHARDTRIKMVKLSRNFGYQGGISAGLHHSRGDWIVVLDGDQQDPPELVPEMIRKAQDGFDLVYGVRTKRRGSKLKTFLYRSFYQVYSLFADIDVPKDAGDFCVMHRKIVDALNNMPERQRFLRGMRTWVGFNQSPFPYIRDVRGEGLSKFNLPKMVALGLDGILSFSIVPLRLSIFAGMIICIAAFVLGGLHIASRLENFITGTPTLFLLPPGLTQIHVVLTLFFGATIFCIGILGEYIGRIYSEVKKRPLFIVDDIVF